MRYSKSWRSLVSLLLLVSLPALAQTDDEPWHSDWLDLVKGYRGDKGGVELTNVEEDEGGATRTITLAIPKKSIRNPSDIEEVVVVGRNPDKPVPVFDMSYEWVEDYDNDNYGLVIRLSKDSKWPIRLYMFSDTGFTR